MKKNVFDYLRHNSVILFVLMSVCSYAQKVGTCVTKDGGIYTGEMKYNKPHGKGKTVYKNGNWYEGHYEKGKRQGFGVYTFSDGEKYEGQWLQDEQNGEGIYYFVNGDRYEGMWVRDYQSGHGVMYYNNGEKYDGKWAFDKRSGHGIMFYRNGDRFDGNWRNDKRSGYGKYICGDGQVLFDGFWIDDLPQGLSTSGHFVNGCFVKDTVNVMSQEWAGTGFALNRDFIVTCYHVVENAKSIQVKVMDEASFTNYDAVFVTADKINDIAILKIANNDYSQTNVPYKLRESVADIGENVFVLGYPLLSTMGEGIKLTTGVVSSKTGYQGDISSYQISAPVQPGNSGGPLFDEQGNVIGIVTAKHAEAENVGYAVKISYLTNLIESSFSKTLLPTKNMIQSLPLPEKVKKIEGHVFLIYCSN